MKCCLDGQLFTLDGNGPVAIGSEKVVQCPDCVYYAGRHLSLVVSVDCDEDIVQLFYKGSGFLRVGLSVDAVVVSKAMSRRTENCTVLDEGVHCGE